jgi:hypothetical protein
VESISKILSLRHIFIYRYDNLLINHDKVTINTQFKANKDNCGSLV